MADARRAGVAFPNRGAAAGDRIGGARRRDVPADWTAIAERGFVELGLGGRVELWQGSIDEVLAAVVEDAAPIDHAFFDADHTEEATVRHFDALLPGLAPGAVVMVDDLLWSDAMRRAGERIKRRDGVAGGAQLGRM